MASRDKYSLVSTFFHIFIPIKWILYRTSINETTLFQWAFNATWAANSTAQLQTFYSAGFYTMTTNNDIPTSTNTTNSITSNGTTTSTSIIITTITANKNSALVIPQSTLVLFFLWILCAINGLLNQQKVFSSM